MRTGWVTCRWPRWMGDIVNLLWERNPGKADETLPRTTFPFIIRARADGRPALLSLEY
jgi:hypothetical protein